MSFSSEQKCLTTCACNLIILLQYGKSVYLHYSNLHLSSLPNRCTSGSMSRVERFRQSGPKVSHLHLNTLYVDKFKVNLIISRFMMIKRSNGFCGPKAHREPPNCGKSI